MAEKGQALLQGNQENFSLVVPVCQRKRQLKSERCPLPVLRERSREMRTTGDEILSFAKIRVINPILPNSMTERRDRRSRKRRRV